MMLQRGLTAANRVVVLVLLSFAVLAHFVAPFSSGNSTILTVKGSDVDAMQQCLLIGSGMDKLVTQPRSYYDTAILYPDRTQLRTTEPFLGYVIAGLPLRAVLNLSDKSVFEALRWLIVFVSLVYTFLVFRAMDLDVLLSAAGAVLCVGQADVVRRVESLQILSILLVAPLFYHWVMAWRSGRRGHSAGLFVFAVLYPLCGIINCVIAAMALAFALPIVVRVLAEQRRQRRLATCVLPVLLAAIVDVIALLPWLLDRSDLQAYSAPEFLQIKHWTPMQVPVPLRDIPAFVDGRVGLGFAAALVLLAGFAVVRYLGRIGRGEPAHTGAVLAARWYLLAPLACGEAVLAIASRAPGSGAAATAQVLFHLSSYLALFMFWRSQARFRVSSDAEGLVRLGGCIGGGLGILLCLVSFGPLHPSNTSLLANHLLNAVLYVLPPLSAIREIGRVWIFGVLFLSIYLTVRLGALLRSSSLATRAVAAAVIAGATAGSIVERTLVASPSLDAPRNVVDLARKSTGTGGIYVHPYMKWNTPSSVLMIPAARDLGRPIVNGCLGIIPPWFFYATNVLHRFPDPEAVWLLQTWNVDTVVSLVGDVRAGEPANIRKVFEDTRGVAYDIAASPGMLEHPSGAACSAGGSTTRLDAVVSPFTRTADGAAVSVTVPPGFMTTAVEIAFRQSVVEWLPASIDVRAVEGDGKPAVNDGRSGQWIQSLAADSLVHRLSPVATIKVRPADTATFEIEFRQSEKPPVERITLCGRWSR
jgi:hypothetical protein